jgi:hypothetical protein
MSAYVKVSYFGYSVAFYTDAPDADARRADANATVLKAFGNVPLVPYVEPGLPFPDYVPVRVWDAEAQDFL